MLEIIFSLIFGLFLLKTNAKEITVLVENGEINGFTQTYNGTEVNLFLGIPYAEPPIGDLRFKKPVPAKKWLKPINATEWPTACYQTKEYLSMSGLKNCSEDCLYLNVVSPISKGSDNALKAVMFWIHGGAFLMGSASQDQYNPIVLSTRGDVVFVSINYRLATLGHLYTGTDVGPGNMALWDQALALKWVSNNIKNFGGDPNRITIFGESAGSFSVSGLIVSPITRDLFQNAIMMSGAIQNYRLIGEPENSLKFWLKQSILLGCNDKHENKFTEKIIECLKNSPADKLVKLPSMFDQSEGLLDIAVDFVVDGEFLTKKPVNMLEQGDYKKNANLLITSTGNEGGNLLEVFVDPQKYSYISPKNFTYIEAYNELKSITDRMLMDSTIGSEEVPKLYFTGLSNQTDTDLLRGVIGKAFGDYLISCPTIEFAKSLFRNDRINANVFQYYFNYKSKNTAINCSKWMGVCHGLDIIPAFGLPFSQFNVSSDLDREISAQMIEILTNFAKTGKPGPIGGAEWPKYYTIGEHIISPYYEITSEPKADTNFNNNLKTDECDYLWKPYI